MSYLFNASHPQIYGLNIMAGYVLSYKAGTDISFSYYCYFLRSLTYYHEQLDGTTNHYQENIFTDIMTCILRERIILVAKSQYKRFSCVCMIWGWWRAYSLRNNDLWDGKRVVLQSIVKNFYIPRNYLCIILCKSRWHMNYSRVIARFSCKLCFTVKAV